MKKRTLNEYRQTKEYKQRDLNSAAGKAFLNFPQFGKDDTGEECPLDPVEEAKILIVDKITKHFQDVMFEMVCNEMGNHYVFQSQHYLTEAGYEMFEDEWFEFVNEHNGDILYQVMQNVTNG
jgi:hypothetical protein